MSYLRARLTCALIRTVYIPLPVTPQPAAVVQPHPHWNHQIARLPPYRTHTHGDAKLKYIKYPSIRAREITGNLCTLFRGGSTVLINAHLALCCNVCTSCLPFPWSSTLLRTRTGSSYPTSVSPSTSHFFHEQR